MSDIEAKREMPDTEVQPSETGRSQSGATDAGKAAKKPLFKRPKLHKPSGMKFSQAMKLALKSLSGSKVRSLLTMLGIIIGVAAVIVLVSLIGGFSNDLSSKFESLGTNLVSVNIRGRGGNLRVEPEDMIELADENSDVLAYCSPTVTVSADSIKYGAQELDTTTITGCNEDYPFIKSYTLSSGRFVCWQDVESRNKIVVIGSYVAQEFFANEDPLGSDIKINGDRYTVVGVLSEIADTTESSQDDVIIMPYTAAQRLSRFGMVNSYVMSSTSSDTAEEAISIIKAYLYKVFSNEDYYSVTSQSQMLEMVSELTGTLTLVLVGVAGISLLVGGIGIMNIMLVSVTERTREIGIRKSLGGKRRDIMRQFVIEAAVTSASGGIIGIIVGIAAAYGAGKIFGMSVAISAAAVIIAFSVSVAIGVVFGYFPAAKAASLNPIEALRYD
ncbi:Macrolide export ATP-binding/permease protein MacB [bioreactor metagenome]|uniref:Macrolide export ATP-binding/permease protein MacB n=1 Tax=bioreactor metagenome TaxID=1076179 RepID=A0A644XX32_9ZZZZ